MCLAPFWLLGACGDDGAAGGSAGCANDSDCKSDRICSDGECVDPNANPSGSGGGDGAGGGGGGTCTDTGSYCEDDSECCSTPNGGGCVQLEVGKFCVAGCAQDTDCESTDCCATLSDGAQVCVLDAFLEPLSETCAGAACKPDAGDSSCVACIKDSCCAESEACANDANCTCYLACLLDGGDLGSCNTECGAPSSASSSAYSCVSSSCNSCPF